MSFFDGQGGFLGIGTRADVRAVRGEHFSDIGSLEHLIINGNDTVTDPKTNLMWQQNSVAKKMNWQEALSYCESLFLGGHQDWRLPTARELLSIVDYREPYTVIESTFFKYGTPPDYWSSTTGKNYNCAWVVDFNIGNHYNYIEKSNSYYVRAVRNVQTIDMDDVFAPSILSLDISPKKTVLTHSGAGIRFLVRAFYNDGSIKIPDGITWQTSDSSTVTIENGKAIAIGEGTATITARDGDGHTAQATVTVQFDPVSLDVSPALLFMESGESMEPSVAALYPDGFQKMLTNSDDYTLMVMDGGSHVSVSGHTISSLSEGTALVQATYENVSAEFRVSVTTPIPLNIVPASARVTQSEAVTVKIDGGPLPIQQMRCRYGDAKSGPLFLACARPVRSGERLIYPPGCRESGNDSDA